MAFNQMSGLGAMTAGVGMGLGIGLGLFISPLIFVSPVLIGAMYFWIQDGAADESRDLDTTLMPFAIVDDAFRKSLDEAFEIGEGIKDQSEAGVLQASESVARIYTDLGNHVRDIESLQTRMNDESIDKSLATVVSKQRSFLEGVPQVLQNIQCRTSDLTKTAVEAQTHTADILALVGDISKITKSSKLLAVNALVEAARAGTRGKGFAVVAITMQQVSEQVAAFSDSIAQIGESMAHILPQMATVSDEISRTCAEQSAAITNTAVSLDLVYDDIREDLVKLMKGLKKGGDKVRINANQILVELQFQDRIRQELERMQTRTRVPLQVLRGLAEEIHEGELSLDDTTHRMWSLLSQIENDCKMETSHSDSASGRERSSGNVEMF